MSRTDAAFVAVLLGGANDGRGDGTFAAPVAIAVDTAGTALAAADLDCDGVLDLVNGGGERVSIRFGGGTY